MLVIFKSNTLAYTKNLWRNRQWRQIQICAIVLQGSGLTGGPVVKRENKCKKELQADGVRNHVQKKKKRVSIKPTECSEAVKKQGRKINVFCG